MPYSFKKDVLIVPLSSFIVFNKKLAGEKFANLFDKSIDDIFSCDEEIKEHEAFSEKLLLKILESTLVADFNLGKKTKDRFIAELVSFLDLPSDKLDRATAAWNSLINFDEKSSAAFEALLNLAQRGKSIYFIGNTNELHAEKILALFSSKSTANLSFLANLNPTSALPLAISHSSNSELSNQLLTLPSGTVYFCLSYAYKTLLEQPPGLLTKLFTSKPGPGLLTHLKIYLSDIGKTKEDILLVNPYAKNNAITKKLALETISKDNFYTDLLSMSKGVDCCDPGLVEVHPTPHHVLGR